MKTFIKKYPATSMFITSCILGTGITNLVTSGILPFGLIILAATSASIAAVILTAIADGKEGVKNCSAAFLNGGSA